MTKDEEIVKKVNRLRKSGASWKQIERKFARAGVLSATGKKLKAPYLTFLVKKVGTATTVTKRATATAEVTIDEASVNLNFITTTIGLQMADTARMEIIKTFVKTL